MALLVAAAAAVWLIARTTSVKTHIPLPELKLDSPLARMKGYIKTD